MRRSIGIAIALILLFQTQVGFLGSAQDTFDESSEFFALIIGISEYENESCGIPAPPFEPYPNWTSRYVYNTLCEASNWKKKNIVLLLDDKASRNCIIAAFEQMAGCVGEDDVFVLCFNGHGAQIEDVDGDEALRNSSDCYDEAICPYDSCLTESGMANVISDDMLADLLDCVAAKRMVLCFECCFSGGMLEETKKSSEPFYLDLEQSDRVVLMSTCESCIGFSSWVVGWPLMYSFSKCISDKRCDENADGWISVQEAWPKTYLLDCKLICFQQFRFDCYGWLINRCLMGCDVVFSNWISSVGCTCFCEAMEYWMQQHGSSHVTLWRIWQSCKVLSGGCVRNEPWMCDGCDEPICLLRL